jgi:hypothetical protein
MHGFVNSLFVYLTPDGGSGQSSNNPSRGGSWMCFDLYLFYNEHFLCAWMCLETLYIYIYMCVCVCRWMWLSPWMDVIDVWMCMMILCIFYVPLIINMSCFGGDSLTLVGFAKPTRVKLVLFQDNSRRLCKADVSYRSPVPALRPAWADVANP